MYASTYGWIPFGGGTRRCLGGGTRRCLGGAFALFELKTILKVIARAGLGLPAEPQDEPVGRRGLTLVPAHGGRILWQPQP